MLFPDLGYKHFPPEPLSLYLHLLKGDRDPAKSSEALWSHKREGVWVPESPCGKLLTEYLH